MLVYKLARNVNPFGFDEGLIEMSIAKDNRLFRPDTGKPQPKIGIVHLGLGAFFRAHGAIYISEAMAKSGGGAGAFSASV